MRHVINISLPQETAEEIKEEVKKEGFSSTSEFFRHILRERKTARLAKILKKDRLLFEKGKGKKLRSLKDLS